MILMDLRKRIMLNFFHHTKNISVDDAEELYNSNVVHINKMFDLIGEDIMIGILKKVKKDDKI